MLIYVSIQTIINGTSPLVFNPMTKLRCNNQKSSFHVIITAIVAAIAGLLFGFDTGVISGALQFIVHAFNIPHTDTFLQEAIVSSVPLGAFLGAICSKFASSWIGRKKSIILTAILFIIGTLFTSLAPEILEIILGRLIMGLAVGLSAMIVPMYLSEISSPKNRGAIVFCFQLAITIGLFSAFLTNYAFSNSGNWRAMFAIGLIPSIILALGMLMLPYSPRWLIAKNNENLARKILMRLRNTNDVDNEINEIKGTLVHKNSSLIQTFSKPIRNVTMICVSLFAFQQLSGINTIMYYAPTIYQHAGFVGAQGQILASLANGIAFILSTVLGIWVVDRLGRRKLFFLGFIGMIVCLFIIGIAYQNIFPKNEVRILALLAVIGYIICFGISLGPLSYLMMSELFPLNVRATGMAVASCSNWGFNVLVSSTFLTLIHYFTISYTFYFYGICTIIGLIFCYFFVPETKGISLEHIEKNIYSGTTSRSLGKI